MIHLVYCDDKSKELDKIIAGSKNMVIRGAAGQKFHIVAYLLVKKSILWKRVARKSPRKP